MPEATNDRVYGPQYKLIGKNYVTLPALLLLLIQHLCLEAVPKLLQ